MIWRVINVLYLFAATALLAVNTSRGSEWWVVLFCALVTLEAVETMRADSRRDLQ